jgi:hypothetical protein
MASQDELLTAISDRLTLSIEQGATSDTILKLAEAWAWISVPGQPHGGYQQA